MLRKDQKKYYRICGFFRNSASSIRIEGCKQPLQNGGYEDVKYNESSQLQQ